MSEIKKYKLLSHCVRGKPGDIVDVWPQDVKALQANGLIGPDAEGEGKSHQSKAEAKAPGKANKAAQDKADADAAAAAAAEAEALKLAGVSQ